MVNSISHIFAFLLLVLPLYACSGDKSAKTDIAEIENCDSIPDGIKRLVKAVAEDDSVGFSAMVSYPLARPYPLRDIESAEQMKGYYPILVDDSLKSVITKSHPGDWEEYGWRGWSLKGGEYVGIDEDLYDVSYLSGRERMMLDSLTLLDIGSVDSALRHGWTPVMCLKGAENGDVYRIDSTRDREGMPHYRMLVYSHGSDLHGTPLLNMTGHMESEGTAGTRTYYFVSDSGLRASFSPDVPDGSSLEIEFTDTRNSTDSVVSVTRVYWLDLTTK